MKICHDEDVGDQGTNLINLWKISRIRILERDSGVDSSGFGVKQERFFECRKGWNIVTSIVVFDFAADFTTSGVDRNDLVDPKSQYPVAQVGARRA